MSRESGSQSYHAELARLHTLKTTLEAAHAQAVQTGTAEDEAEADRLVEEMKTGMEALRSELNPYEHGEMKLKEQYEGQVAMLSSLTKEDGTPLLETLPSGEQGIRAIDGKEYPIPTYKEVVNRLLSKDLLSFTDDQGHEVNREKQELMKTKIAQGFTKLTLVPFGASLNDLMAAYKQKLQYHFDSGKLFYTRKDPTDKSEPVPLLSTEGPLYVWDGLKDADRKGTLIYHPKTFTDANDPAHGGKTKQQLLTETKSGWMIELIEDLPNIPRQGKGQILGNRPQKDTGGTGMEAYIQKDANSKTQIPNPIEYLAAIQGEQTKDTSPYRGEHGLTLESYLTYALTHLTQTNEVVDDYQGHGSIAYLTGAYVPASGDVPTAYWNRGHRQARLNGGGRGNRSVFFGLRSAVGV